MSVQVTVIALAFALMGLGAFLRPRSFLSMFGIEAATADARNEVQAVYGGFGLAVAGTLCAAMWYAHLREGIVIAVAVALLGMAGGRLIGAIRERPGRWPVVFFGVEVIGGAVFLTAL